MELPETDPDRDTGGVGGIVVGAWDPWLLIDGVRTGLGPAECS